MKNSLQTKIRKSVRQFIIFRLELWCLPSSRLVWKRARLFRVCDFSRIQRGSINILISFCHFYLKTVFSLACIASFILMHKLFYWTCFPSKSSNAALPFCLTSVFKERYLWFEKNEWTNTAPENVRKELLFLFIDENMMKSERKSERSVQILENLASPTQS